MILTEEGFGFVEKVSVCFLTKTRYLLFQPCCKTSWADLLTFLMVLQLGGQKARKSVTLTAQYIKQRKYILEKTA